MHKKRILITGGTGTLGNSITKYILSHYDPYEIRIYSRAESSQVEMEREIDDKRVKFILGNICDFNGLSRAMIEVDVVIHTAALKHVNICERNPVEAINTNIIGTINVIQAARKNLVDKVIFTSSDKAVHPISLYGSTKLIGEKLIVNASKYDNQYTKFSAVRLGNIVGSSGSVIPIFQRQKLDGRITITNKNMTRFWITKDQTAEFIIRCLTMMKGGEIFVPKLPSTTLENLANAIAPEADKIIIGMKDGERIHEVLLAAEESLYTSCYDDYFLINSDSSNKEFSGESFEYSSNSSESLLAVNEIINSLGL